MTRVSMFVAAVLISALSGGATESGWELEAEYVSRYLFRGTDLYRDNPALLGHIEGLFPDVLDPGDLKVGVWSAFDTGEAQASDRDELRYYTALTNVTPDRQLRFALGATYYDRRGEGPFLEDSDEFDFYEWWVSVQFLEFLFQPDLQVYYDHPASGSGPEDGVYAGLTLRQPLPLGRFGGFIGLSQLNLSSTFWYQDGVFGYEPGSSLEASIEAPMTLWGLEVRPGVGVSQLFDEPEGSRISDDREDWWYSIAVTYRFGRPYVEPRAPGPFDVSAE